MIPDETLEELESEDDLDALDELEDDLEETDDDLDEELDDVEVELDLLHELDDELDDALSGAETEPDQVPEDLDAGRPGTRRRRARRTGTRRREPKNEPRRPETNETSKTRHRGLVEHDETYVPPMTEEEQTINMQIDQDLMALAMEGRRRTDRDHGFSG